MAALLRSKLAFDNSVCRRNHLESLYLTWRRLRASALRAFIAECSVQHPIPRSALSSFINHHALRDKCTHLLITPIKASVHSSEHRKPAGVTSDRNRDAGHQRVEAWP